MQEISLVLTDFIMSNIASYNKNSSSMSFTRVNGCIVGYNKYPGIRQYLLFVKCVLETSRMSMF